MQTTTQENYYVTQKEAMLQEFDQLLKRVTKVMAHHYGAEGAIEIGEDARHEYALLIPQLPFIGGKRNPLTWNLVGSAWFQALYRVLRKRGEPVEKIGKITYEMFEAWYNAYPPLPIAPAGAVEIYALCLLGIAAASRPIPRASLSGRLGLCCPERRWQSLRLQRIRENNGFAHRKDKVVGSIQRDCSFNKR